MNSNQNKIKVVNRSATLELPKYQTTGSDGLDVMACFDCIPTEESEDKYVPVVIFSPRLVVIDKLVEDGFKLVSGAPLFMNEEGDICTKLAFIEGTDDKNFEIRKKISVTPDSCITLYPGERALIPTGLSTQMDESRRIHVSPRSGLSLKEGITVLNTPGKVDSDYTGVIGVILINHGNSPFKIKHGDRIAQIAIEESHKLTWDLVGGIEDTERGSGGFGSTGVTTTEFNSSRKANLFEEGELTEIGRIVKVDYDSAINQYVYTIEDHVSDSRFSMVESDLEQRLL